MPDTTSHSDDVRLLDLTASIVAAHASHNKISLEQLPTLITSVHHTLGNLGNNLGQPPADSDRPQPAVPIRRSVSAAWIICLECGTKMKMLKRHLTTEHGMNAEAYRERWGLKRDYPLVAPDYAEARSGVAKRIGLGRKREDIEPAPEAAMPAAPTNRRRGRPAKQIAA